MQIEELKKIAESQAGNEYLWETRSTSALSNELRLQLQRLHDAIKALSPIGNDSD